MSDDLIRRSDAKIEIEAWFKIIELNPDILIDNINSIPSIKPKQGEWIKQDIASYRCSECGKTQIADDANELNYCCYCGSKNRIKIKRRK